MVDLKELRTGGTVLPITRWGEPVMHEVCKPVTVFDDELRALIKDMFATMEAAAGVGLAATQVGRDIQLFIYDCPDDDNMRHVGVMCNPVLELPEGKDRHLVSDEEGCLSFPGAYESLARPDKATCTGVDHNGEPVTLVGTGLFARCLQHETDHLNGTVFGDRLSGRNRRKLNSAQESVNDLYPEDWPVSKKRPRV